MEGTIPLDAESVIVSDLSARCLAYNAFRQNRHLHEVELVEDKLARWALLLDLSDKTAKLALAAWEGMARGF